MSPYRTLLLFFFFISFTDLYGQKMPDDYFDEGVEASKNNNDSLALADYYYIVNNHPKNEIFPRAYYNIGYTYYKTQDYTNAVKIFRNILKGEFNDLEPSGRPGIMSNPYANYKHNAASLLSKIYENRALYDTALFYLFQADTLYTYEHFCGNEQMANRIYTAVKYANLYEHLNQTTKAEKVLLAVSFSSGLASNQEALDELNTLFKKHGNPKQLRTDLEKSINDYIVDTNYYDTDTTFSYYILFQGEKIEFYYGGFGGMNPRLFTNETDNKISEREKIIAYLKKSELYKIIKDL